jgi:hypothetical protein
MLTVTSKFLSSILTQSATLLLWCAHVQEKEDLEKRIDLFQRKADDLAKEMDDRVSVKISHLEVDITLLSRQHQDSISHLSCTKF